MHNDVIRVSEKEILKPMSKEIVVVYFSSPSNNTHRFIQKLNFENYRIPWEIENELTVKKEFVIVTPTYGGGGSDLHGAVPKQVIKFLNNYENRNLCRGVIASGNTNFGDTFAAAGPIISKKLNVPLLYQFELLGTSNDVNTISQILENFWDERVI